MKYNIENLETQTLIRRFLEGELDEKDRQEFLSAMKTDKVLAKEVAINEAILLNNTQPDIVKMKSIMSDIAKSTVITPNLDIDITDFESLTPTPATGSPNSDTTLQKPSGSIGKWLGGGLIASIGIVTLLWFSLPDLFYFNKAELIVLAAKEMSPLEDIFILSEEDDSPLSQGMIFYKTEKYLEAIKQYDNHLSRHPDDSEVQLFKAVAYLFKGDLDVAIAQLKQLVEIDDSFINSHSNWYLSLAYLKNKQPSKAKVLLNQLKEDNYYAQQAQKLLEQL